MPQQRKLDEQYSAEEAERRFVDTVEAGLNTKPLPLKSIVPKGVPAQSRKSCQLSRKK
jgi:hypothetical protein